jgi:hypothetical protein
VGSPYLTGNTSRLRYRAQPVNEEFNEEREVGGSERHYGWGEHNLSSVLKVLRHCPFVLLVSVSF